MTVINILKYIFRKNITVHRKAKIHNKGTLTLSDNAKLTIGRRRNKAHPHRPTTLIVNDGANLKITEQLSIFSNGIFKIGKNASVHIGSVFINENFSIDIVDSITIGNGVLVGNNSFITDTNHHALNGKVKTLPIVIEDNVWIGANCTILPGAIIRQGSVIAAGSVVNKEILPHSLYGGVPAKLIKQNISWER